MLKKTCNEKKLYILGFWTKMLLVNSLLMILNNPCAVAQDQKEAEPYRNWEIGINAGISNFAGSTNMDKTHLFNHFYEFKSDINLGYGLFVRRNFSHVFALEAAYNGTNLTGKPKPEFVTWRGNTRMPFKTGINELDLNTVWNMNNLFSSNKFDRRIYWYMKIGLGITQVNNKKYSDVTDMEPTCNWTIPVGTGISVRLADKVRLNLGTQLSWVNTNRLDGANQGGNGTDYLIGQIREQYLYTHAGLSVILGQKKKPEPVAEIIIPVAPPAPAPLPEPVVVPKPQVQPAPAEVLVAIPTVVGKVYKLYYGFGFGYDKSNLSSQALLDLDNLIKDMNEYPSVRVEIKSYADCRGKAEYNMKLSERRGQSVVDYLANHGISKSRMIVLAYGESEPVNKCVDGVPCTEEEHAQNRRTETTIIK